MEKEEFGILFDYLCEQSSMNDANIAKVLDVDRATVGRWRKGERTPNLSILPKIANLFRIDMNAFTYDHAKDYIDTLNNNNDDDVLKNLQSKLKNNDDLTELLSNIDELSSKDISILKDMAKALNK